jgi:hypothetical protein
MIGVGMPLEGYLGAVVVGVRQCEPPSAARQVNPQPVATQHTRHSRLKHDMIT